MAKITNIRAREVLDSRGNPTVEAIVEVDQELIASAFVPSGASTGKYEAHELRDKDDSRYHGKGVLKAVANVTDEIAAELMSMDVTRQAEIDQRMIELDGTPNKSRLGSNAILAVSLATARAAAKASKQSLYSYIANLSETKKFAMPIGSFNVINGGQHASNGLDVQEFQIIPAKASSFAESIRITAEIYFELGKLLNEMGVAGLGDEGGYAGSYTPKLDSTEEALSIITRACEVAGYTPGSDIWLGMDPAATEFFDEEVGVYRIDGGELSPGDLAENYASWCGRYQLISIEDPFAEDAWGDWKKFVATHHDHTQVIGDDLLTTNITRIKKGISEKAATAVLVKLNQIGSLTETLLAIKEAQSAGWQTVISHRSGDTEDTFIADLAVGTGSQQIKMGSLARSERTAKYNRLIAIEQEEGYNIADPFHDIV